MQGNTIVPLTDSSSRFLPMPAADTVRVWAPIFISRTGSPALSQRNSVTMWLLDGAATEDISAVAYMPTSWATYNVVVRYVNAGAGSGDVRWTLLKADIPADDVSTSATASVGNTTSTAGAADVMKTHTLGSGVAVPATGMVALHVRRIGGDALDTLANDIGVLYVDLVKAS